MFRNENKIDFNRYSLSEIKRITSYSEEEGGGD